MSHFNRLVEEPPFRLLAYFLVKRFAKSVRTIDHWGAVDRPQYFSGVLAAADQALREGVREIAVFEFGVAGGNGLVALQAYAETIERETGVGIRVFGFDTGEGLPGHCGDYRDHPDQWRAQDYRMDVPRLKARLAARTTLVLGNIAETIPAFVAQDHPPTGFVACDVDYYSSTKSLLQLFTLPGKRMLMRVHMYFDDVDSFFNHRFAGELLAIDEFNAASPLVKIDQWRSLKRSQVFATLAWLDRMYVATDLEAVNRCVLTRAPSDGECALDGAPAQALESRRR